MLGLGLGLGLLLGLGLGLGLLLGLGLGLALLLGLGLALLLGLVLGLGLLWLVLGLGLLWLVLGLGLLSLVLLWLVLGLPLLEISDAETASAVAASCPEFRVEATLAALAGRVAHGVVAAEAALACVPARSTLARPHETAAVPAHAPKVADTERRILTISTSPWSMPRQGLRSSASLITLCASPKWAFPSVPVRHHSRRERREGKEFGWLGNPREETRIRVRS